MTTTPSAILFIPDIFRIPVPRHDAWDTLAPWRAMAESVYHISRLPASLGSGLPCRFLTDKEIQAPLRQFYSQLTGEMEEPERQQWIKLYWQTPNKHALALAQEICGTALAAGFDLSPFTRTALTLAGISWINIDFHPVRFMPQLFFTWSSNLSSADAFLRRKAVPPLHFSLKAAQHQARYALTMRNRLYYLPENSLLLLSQSWQDPPPVGKHGRLIHFADCAEELFQLKKNHEAVYFYTLKSTVRPDDVPGHQEKDFLEKEIGAVSLPDLRYPFSNSYMLLSHPSVATVAGLRSKSLCEAEYFGKRAVALAPETAATKTQPLPETHAIDRHCFTPAFWREMLHEVSACTETFPDISLEEDLLPETRLIFRGGGSDFDDASSFTHCQLIGSLRTSHTFLQNDMLLHHIHHGIKTAPEFPAPAPLTDAADAIAPRQKTGKESKPRHAVYSAGSSELLVPVLVALQTLCRHSGQADAFFITDTNELTAKDHALLEEYAITALHSQATQTLSTRYMHGRHFAYLQLFTPELLYTKGYTHSIGIHADVICVHDFDPLPIFQNTRYFSGTGVNNYTSSFAFADLKPIKDITNAPSARFQRHLPNPGVLFANNTALHDMSFTNKAMDIYNRLGPESLLLNEESMLTLFMLMDEEFFTGLDGRYHYFDPACKPGVTPYLLHLHGPQKPWGSPPTARLGAPYMPLASIFSLWHDIARAILGKGRYAEYMQKKLP